MGLAVNWQLIGVLISLIGAINGLILWAVKILLARQQSELHAQIEEVEKRGISRDVELAELRREIAEHKLDAMRQFLHRDDAVIYFSRFEQKIDSVWEYLHERAHGPGSN